MTTPTQLEHLDPRQLTEHPGNARTDLGDLTGLTASIAAQGVIEPLTVVPLPTGHMVLAGHRRRAAAIEAGLATVPCVVRDDLMAVSDNGPDVIEQQVTMLSENVHRRNLDAVEEARAVQQLIDLGLTPTKIAGKTGLSRKHVAKAAGVALLDQDTAAAVAQAGLDLEQAAVVATYRDDPAVAADLVEKAAQGPGVFVHAVARAKQDRDRRAEFLAKETELRDAGRTLVDTAAWDGPTNRRVVSLAPADGNGRLTVDEHNDCPGSAVLLAESASAGVVLIEVCTDFRSNGHTDPFAATSSKAPAAELPPEQREAARVERAQLIEDNRAMTAANTVRRQWIRTTLLERRRGEKDVLRFAVEAMAAYPNAIGAWLTGNHSTEPSELEVALGLTAPRAWRGDQQTTSLTSGEKVTEARLPLQLLAHVAGGLESFINRESHRQPQDYAAAWFTFLVGQGYALSEIEQRIVDTVAHRSKQ